jgi:hypothetical protein
MEGVHGSNADCGGGGAVTSACVRNPDGNKLRFVVRGAQPMPMSLFQLNDRWLGSAGEPGASVRRNRKRPHLRGKAGPSDGHTA